MGVEAKDSRRALIEKVKECVTQTNAMTGLATDVREANNKLATQTEADVTEIKGRLDAQGKMIVRLETTAKRADDRVSLLRKDSHAAVQLLYSFTFLDRLRWLVFGVLPLNEHTTPFVSAWLTKAEASTQAPTAPEKRTAIVVEHTGARTLRGAGMAPRPMP